MRTNRERYLLFFVNDEPLTLDFHFTYYTLQNAIDAVAHISQNIRFEYIFNIVETTIDEIENPHGLVL